MSGTPAPVIRIVVADDHPVFRQGLRRLLEAEPDFQVVGEAGDGAEAIQLVKRLNPEILLLDLAMPHVHGLEALAEMSSASNPVRTIVLTAAIETPQIVEALQLGARGVVLKHSASELLMKGIRAVMAGQYWVGRDTVSDLVQAIRVMAPTARTSTAKQKFDLTPRELDIVGAVVQGFTNKDIAQKFSLSEQTVKHHLTNIFNKTGVSNRLELALFAINHRLASGES
jgi:DNA-binding NarL/FixJ family response regulator